MLLPIITEVRVAYVFIAFWSYRCLTMKHEYYIILNNIGNIWTLSMLRLLAANFRVPSSTNGFCIDIKWKIICVPDCFRAAAPIGSISTLYPVSAWEVNLRLTTSLACAAFMKSRPKLFQNSSSTPTRIGGIQAPPAYPGFFVVTQSTKEQGVLWPPVRTPDSIRFFKSRQKTCLCLFFTFQKRI